MAEIIIIDLKFNVSFIHVLGLCFNYDDEFVWTIFEKVLLYLCYQIN